MANGLQGWRGITFLLTEYTKHGNILIMNKFEKSSDQPQLPTETDDDAILRMLAGANFAPGARVTLPTGREMSGDELTVATSAFPDGETAVGSGLDEPQPYVDLRKPVAASHHRVAGENDNPLDSRFDDWTGDPNTDIVRLVARALSTTGKQNKKKRWGRHR